MFEMKLSPTLKSLASAWFEQAQKARIKTTTKALLGPTKAKLKANTKAGTVFTRTWRGRLYRAEILAKGVECNGTTYSSLSAAAKAVTGQQISGPRFFGAGA